MRSRDGVFAAALMIFMCNEAEARFVEQGASTEAAAASAAAPALLRSEAASPRPSRSETSTRLNAESADEKDTISVVLPCLNETSNMVNTVRRFCERTPPEILQEVIVVDDGSSPALAEILHMAGLYDSSCPVRVMRHAKAMGLMVAKQTGGDVAAGKYIGFFDCHVAPNREWYREIIDLLREKPRRLVVPQIGDLNMTSWDEKAGGALTAKCYVTWNADFWWYEDDSKYMPAISGGLVATSRQWWRDSGGFERGMRGWGGENTDQSIKTWLCGGDIVRAKSSVVAHMWRDGTAGTKAHYNMASVQTDNAARVAKTWFDEFRHVFRNGDADSLAKLNVTDALERKAALGCKPFVFFLHRFRKLYRDAGMLPDMVFRLRSRTEPSRCISRSGGKYVLHQCSGATWFHMANLLPHDWAEPPEKPMEPVLLQADGGDEQASSVSCGGDSAANCAACPRGHGASWCNGDCQWVFGMCIHRGTAVKQRADKKCCSGIREWRGMDCFDRFDESGPLPYYCDVTGHNGNQQYLLDGSGAIRHTSGFCVNAADGRPALERGDCENATKWEQIDMFQPEETALYKKLVAKYELSDDLPDS